jgi:hypothetical protein
MWRMDLLRLARAGNTGVAPGLTRDERATRFRRGGGAAVLIAVACCLGTGVAAAQPRDSISRLRSDLEALRTSFAVVASESGSTNMQIAEVARRIEVVDAQVRAFAANGHGAAVDQSWQAAYTALATHVAQLQSDIATLADTPIPPQVDHDHGFVWTSDDEKYWVRIGGYLQARWSLDARSIASEMTTGGDTDNGFAVRRARVILEGEGQLGLGFRLMPELVPTIEGEGPELLDAYLVGGKKRVSVRAGKDKVPYTRSWLVSESHLLFAERAGVIDAFRWDRDVGVSVRVEGKKSSTILALANGGPEGEVDDVPLFAFRSELQLRGGKPGGGDDDDDEDEDDWDERRKAKVSLGLGFVADSVPLPSQIAGLMIDNLESRTGEPDRILVLGASADLLIRKRQFGLAIEGLARWENWTDRLMANPGLVDLIGSNDPSRSYYAIAAEGTVSIRAPVTAGLRVAHGDLPFFSVRGPSDVLPVAKDATEITTTIQLFADRMRLFNLSYGATIYGDPYTPTPAAPRILDYRVIVEGQLNL